MSCASDPLPFEFVEGVVVSVALSVEVVAVGEHPARVTAITMKTANPNCLSGNLIVCI